MQEVMMPKDVMFVAAALCDALPQETDAVCVHAQNDLQKELLAVVADPTVGLYHKLFPRSPKILLNGLLRYEKAEASWGFEEWRRILEGSLAVKLGDVLSLGVSRHTGEEAEAVLRYCRQYGWKSLTVAATPYRLPRCFLTVLGAMHHRDLDLKLHCLTVPRVNWSQRVEKLSVMQGAVVGTRFAQLEAELERIVKYREAYLAGDLAVTPIASIEEGLTYLQERQ